MLATLSTVACSSPELIFSSLSNYGFSSEEPQSNGSQSEVILPLEDTGQCLDISNCHMREEVATHMQSVEARDAAKYPSMHRHNPHSNK